MKKRILSLVLIASLVLSAAGCGETGSSDEINLDNIDEKIENMSDDEIEQAVLDGAEKLEEEYGNGLEITEAATTTAASEPEEIVYEPTQEILDADFSSMKIQINNDVFQIGGYVTVAEFYEQYKDKYDFTYSANGESVSYEDGKDYLLEYSPKCTEYDILSTLSKEWYTKYTLKLSPKFGNTNYSFNVYIANLTSPDSKVTLEEAYVIHSEADNEVGLPVWLSGGFKVHTLGTVASVNEPIKYDVTIDDFAGILKEQGYIEGNTSVDQGAVFSRASSPVPYITWKVSAVANAAGMCPVIVYNAYVDSNTDKLKNMEIQFIYFLEQ